MIREDREFLSLEPVKTWLDTMLGNLLLLTLFFSWDVKLDLERFLPCDSAIAHKVTRLWSATVKKIQCRISWKSTVTCIMCGLDLAPTTKMSSAYVVLGSCYYFITYSFLVSCFTLAYLHISFNFCLSWKSFPQQPDSLRARFPLYASNGVPLKRTELVWWTLTANLISSVHLGQMKKKKKKWNLLTIKTWSQLTYSSVKSPQ